MFAQVQKSRPELSSRLKEIDIANENQHPKHSEFVNRFNATHAHECYASFIIALNKCCVGKTRKNISHTNESINSFLFILNKIESLIDTSVEQLHDKTAHLNNTVSRFGNPAFRTFVKQVRSQSSELLRTIIEKHADKSLLPDVVIPISEQTSNNNPSGAKNTGKVELSTDAALSKISPPSPQLSPRSPLKPLAARSPNSDSVLDKLSSNDKEHHKHIHPKVLQSLQEQESKGLLPAPTNEEDVKEPVIESKIDFSKPIHSDKDRIERIVYQLSAYLNSSFGDAQRIDYGTGHELNFLCLLCCLSQLGVFGSCSLKKKSSLTAETSAGETEGGQSAYQLGSTFDFQLDEQVGLQLVLLVFEKYIQHMRRLQRVYLLEPAGSRGVWGLDDYCFLPFLFGAAQLVDHPHLRPKSVRYEEMVEQFGNEYMYFESIQFINSVKLCSFAEHSPMLNDITAVKTWRQVNDGLLKMYEGAFT